MELRRAVLPEADGAQAARDGPGEVERAARAPRGPGDAAAGEGRPQAGWQLADQVADDALDTRRSQASGSDHETVYQVSSSELP
jgi:hypothetical protein